MEQATEHLKVAVRIRPLIQSDPSHSEASLEVHANTIQINDTDHYLNFEYDRVFTQDSQQEDVFDFVNDSVQQMFRGFNCTILAYGQTGSGKTYTMFGSSWESLNPAPQIYYDRLQPKRKFAIRNRGNPLKNPELFGVIPKTIELLFQQSSTFTFYCSFIQIYNEHIFDLLNDQNRQKALNIREDQTNGIFVENLAEYVVESPMDCFMLLKKGERSRAVRQTRFNNHSSRSHTILQILVESDKANKKGFIKKAKINLCDLAGSERFDKSNHMVREHISELSSINKSLATLGKVVAILAQRGKAAHVPYRDSKLTRLLQDSLGINTRTIIIATVSPANNFIDETINTLKFADRARQVMVKVVKNNLNANNDQMVTKLQREIQYLKQLLQIKRDGGIQKLQEQVEALRQENLKLKKSYQQSNVELVEQLKSENKKLRVELQKIAQNTSQYSEQSFISADNVNDSATSPSTSGNQNKFNIESVLDALHNESIQVYSQEEQIPIRGRCPICTLKIPCRHYKDSKELLQIQRIRQSESVKFPRVTSVTNRSQNDISLSVRYRGKSSTVESGKQRKIQLQQTKRQQIQEVSKRFNIIAKVEAYKEQKALQKIQELEVQRFKEEREEKLKIQQEKKRRHYLNRQKQKLEAYYRSQEEKLQEFTQQQAQIQQKLKLEKEKKKKIELMKKQKIADFHQLKSERVIDDDDNQYFNEYTQLLQRKCLNMGEVLMFILLLALDIILFKRLLVNVFHQRLHFFENYLPLGLILLKKHSLLG